MNEKNSFYAGVDWASQKHDVWLTDSAGKRLGFRNFPHSGEGLSAMCKWLVEVSGGEPGDIQIAIEVPHGPIVETLLERGFHVYAINPKQLDRFRDRFTLAGAKDDSRDAETMASSLRTDMRAFRKLALADPNIIELREYSRMAEELTAEKIRLSNRIHAHLWRYYPQMIELADDVFDNWVLDLWSKIPTPQKAARVHEKTVAGILKSNRIRRIDAAGVLAILRKEPLIVAPGTTRAATAHISNLIDRMRLVNRQIKKTHKELDRIETVLCEPPASGEKESEPGQTSGQEEKQVQRDAAILHSLPGIGRINLATLLTEASDALQNRDYHALRCLSGVAPVTKRSGKRCIVVRRSACHPRIRNAVYHWARIAIQHDDRARARYDALRAKGHNHARALRSVGDRLLKMACSMLKNGTLYNPLQEAHKKAC